MDMDKEGKLQEADKSHYGLLWGASWLLKLPMSLSTTHSSSKSRKKRRRSQGVAQENQQLDVKSHSAVAGEESLTSSPTKLIAHYRPILHVDFLGSGELVVVERPLIDVLNTLPPAYFKHKYGSS
jgi:U3 small nucleolar RNA-associated protein 4